MPFKISYSLSAVQQYTLYPLMLLSHVLFFIFFSFVAFLKVAQYSAESGESFLLFGFDGTFIHTTIQSMNRWREIGINWGLSPLQAPGHEWFPLNSTIIPWHTFEILSGHTTGVVALYVILAMALFLSFYYFCRAWGLGPNESLVGAWALPILTLPYTAPPQLHGGFSQSPHWTMQLILCLLSLAIFRSATGQRLGTTGIKVVLFCAGVLLVFILSPHRASPLIPMFVAVTLIALGLSTSRKELFSKLGILFILWLSLKLSGLEAFYEATSARALFSAKLLWSLDHATIPSSGKILEDIRPLDGVTMLYGLFVDPLLKLSINQVREVFGNTANQISLFAQPGVYVPRFVGIITLGASLLFLLCGNRPLRVIAFVHLLFQFYIYLWGILYYDIGYMPVYALLIALSAGVALSYLHRFPYITKFRFALHSVLLIPWLMLIIPGNQVGVQPWPPAETKFIKILRSEIGLERNQPYSGLVSNLSGYDRTSDTRRAWSDQHMLDNKMNKELGNDHRFQGLWYFDIPTLSAPQISPNPYYMLFISLYLNKPPHSHQSWAITQQNEKFLRMSGVRFVISEYELGDAFIERARIFTSATTTGVYKLFELSEFQMGYSPENIIQTETLADELRMLSSNSFNSGVDTVISRTIEGTFSAARDIKMYAVRGGIRVTAKAEGEALIIVPIVYSHCLKTDETNGNISLMRSNVMNTAVRFSGNLDTVINHIRSPIGFDDCSKKDIEEVTALLPSSSASILVYGGYGLNY